MVDIHAPDPDQLDDVGRVLRALRKAKGWTGQYLGSIAGMSQAKISRIETGALLAETEDVETLAKALSAGPAETQRLIELAARARVQQSEWQLGAAGVADRQREFVDLEAGTRELRIYQPAVVAGLLQTSEYARAVLAGFQDQVALGQLSAPTSVVSEAVSTRVRRHEILADPAKAFHFVLSESALTNRLTAPAVMLAQLERIREVSAQSNVTVRIVPSDADISIPPYHGFELLDDRCVTVDLFNTTIMSRVKSDITLYRHVFDELERVATAEIDPILDRYADLYLRLTTEALKR